MMVTVVIIPLALLIRTLLIGGFDDRTNSKDNEPSNTTSKLVADAYGDEKKMGVIGRPYP